MATHLVIPDQHAMPGVDNDRFELAGRFALAKRPDVIINLGDLASMESLSSYDKGHKSFEGRRYSGDIESANDALDRFNAPIDIYNRQQRRNHKPQYLPRMVFLMGNHEYRINRAIDLSPELDGTMSIDDIQLKKHGWEVKPFLKMTEIDGVWYNHYFISGVLGGPIGGINPARQMLNKHMSSCTAGHSHIFDYAVATGPSGKRVYSIVAGCYFRHELEYAHATSHLWWRGLVFKNDVHEGEYDMEMWSMDRLEKEYA
jgi:hypothetical protein